MQVAVDLHLSCMCLLGPDFVTQKKRGILQLIDKTCFVSQGTTALNYQLMNLSTKQKHCSRRTSREVCGSKVIYVCLIELTQ